MKKLLFLAIILVFYGCSSGGGKFRSVKDIKSSGVLNVYVYAAGKPFSYNDNGVLTGTEVAAAEAVARELSVMPSLRQAEAAEIYAALQNGDADIAVGMFVNTSASRSAAGFTDPIGKTGLYAVSRAGLLPNTTGAFEGRKAGAVGGSAAEYALMISSARPSEIVSYTSVETALEGLANGDCDIVVCGETEAEAATVEYPGILSAEYVTNAPEVEFSMMVARNNTELTALANAAIAKLE